MPAEMGRQAILNNYSCLKDHKVCAIVYLIENAAVQTEIDGTRIFTNTNRGVTLVGLGFAVPHVKAQE